MPSNIDAGVVEDRVPFEPQFEVLRGRLSPAEFDPTVARVGELIDESGAEIATAGWLRASDWTVKDLHADLHEGGARRLRPLGHVLRAARLARDHAMTGALVVGEVTG